MQSKINNWMPKSACRAIACALLLMAVVLPAQAQFATGGTGLHRGRIFWVDWGNNGDNVFAGETITRGFNIGSPATSANRLDITCTLSNASSTGATSLTVYTPGSWQGDGLDDLYNIGGNQPGQGANPNTLRVGLATPNSTTVEFDFSCSATLGGAPFELNGLVFADAEASGGTEYVAARLTGGGTLRVIDEIAQCRGSDTTIRSTVTVLAGSPEEVQFAGPTAPATSCQSNTTPSLRAGPALVGFIDGALSARVIARGSGISAVAVGAVLDLEFSENIPSSYGTAAVHVLNTNWTGGVAVSGGDFNDPANLATVVPGPRLGNLVESDADASEDIGGADVDALPKTSGPAGAGYADVPPPTMGTSYTIENIVCAGPASVAGWIDFDGNGVFDGDERSAVVNCPSGSGNTVSLTWALPADYAQQATSYMRLRLSPDPAGVNSPTGMSTGGEVEDYRLALPQLVPTVTIAKISTGGVGTFSFTGDNGISAQNLTTTAPNTAVSGAPQPLAAVNTTTTITEAATAGFTLTGIACTGLGAGGTATPDLAARTVTLDAAATAGDANITCTFTNGALADLQITKTNTPANGTADGGSDTVLAGSSVEYNIVVNNLGPNAADGAVVRDTAPSGLTCNTAACDAATNGAACPAETGAALATAMQSSAGVSLPSLPVNSSVTIIMFCDVTP